MPRPSSSKRVDTKAKANANAKAKASLDEDMTAKIKLLEERYGRPFPNMSG